MRPNGRGRSRYDIILGPYYNTYNEAKEAVLTYFVTFEANGIETIAKELEISYYIVAKILRDYLTPTKERGRSATVARIIKWKVAEKAKIIKALEDYNERAPEEEKVNI